MPEPDQNRPAAAPPLHSGRRVLRNTAGAALLLIGVGGLFLPLLQCVLMIGGGLLLLDLPQKAKAHARLRRLGWYRVASDRFAGLARTWNDFWSETRGPR